jgi:AbrB family looped-hinge helix DNA binding protein
MMEIATVSTKGQVVIPEQFRKMLNISSGSRVIFREKQGILFIELEDSILHKMAELEEKQDWERLGLQQLRKDWDNEIDEQWDKYA